jgi:hypothetical protein
VDSSIEKCVVEYIFFSKKMNKNANKLIISLEIGEDGWRIFSISIIE